MDRFKNKHRVKLNKLKKNNFLNLEINTSWISDIFKIVTASQGEKIELINAKN